jgi:hypothetical protein
MGGDFLRRPQQEAAEEFCMKKFFVGARVALPVLAALLVAAMVLAGFASCASSSPAMSASKPTGPAYTGDGGAGKSLTILAPQGKGLTQEQDYLLLLVQGEFVSNFSDYSAISVLDRIRLDEQYSELYSGYYDDYAEGVYDLGHLIPTEYIMGGSITKTASGYALQISITKSTDKMTVASHSGTCTFAELDNLSGIRRASLDLLQKMGVESTKWAKAELSGAASRRTVQAQTALAQGISAQRAGNEFSAMTNYFEARTFDAALPEVQARMVSAANSIAAGGGVASSLRDQVMGEIQRQREEIRIAKERKEAMKALLEKATEFYKAHQPFEVAAGDSFSIGNINQVKETVDVTLDMSITPLAEEFAIIRQLSQQAAEFGWGLWPFRYSRAMADKIYFFVVPVLGWSILLGLDPIVLNNIEDSPGFDIWRVSTSMFDESSPEDARKPASVDFNIKVEVLNEYGKVIKRDTWTLKEEIGRESISPKTVSGKITFTAPVADLSDTLTVRIVSVNGKSVQSGYVKTAQPVKTIAGGRF